MKFLFVFLIGIIALVSANEYPSQKQIDEVQQKFEEAVNKTTATCNTHEDACVSLVNSDKHQRFLYKYQIKDAIEECTDLAKQYLCEGKKTGKKFEPLAVGYLELREDTKRSICKNVYYVNKETVSSGKVSSEDITKMIEDFHPEEH